MRILDLAADKDVHTSIRGDVQLISNILDRHGSDSLQKMQQVRSVRFLLVFVHKHITCKQSFTAV